MYAINEKLRIITIDLYKKAPNKFLLVTESLAFAARNYFGGKCREDLPKSFFKLTGKQETVITGFYEENLFCIGEFIFEEIFENVFMELQLKNRGSPDTSLLQRFICYT